MAPSGQRGTLGWVTYPWVMAVADVNGDGRLDVVTANRDSVDVSVLVGKGDGTFQTARHFGVGDFPGDLAVADVNENGRLDLITGINTGVSVLLQ